MGRYFVVSVVSGILFGALDAFINANPLAQRLYEFYKPIARASVNAAAGVAIDLVYGFVMAGAFLILYESLPGEGRLLKGLAFAIMVWFFRVVMSVATQWITFKVPIGTLVYTLAAGLGELVILGIFYGLALNPSR